MTAAAANPAAEAPSPLRSISPHPVMVTITLLMVIGVVMVYSALAGMEGPQEGTPWYKLTSIRSMIFAPAAFAVMLLMSRFPYRKLDSQLIWVFAGACIVMLLAVYVPGIGVEKNFRHRWIKVPGIPDEFAMGFQPSEIAKFGLVVFLAWWLGRRGSEPRSFLQGFVPGAGAVLITAGLIAKEDLGTGIITGAVGFLLLLMGGCRFWHVSLAVPLVLAGLFLTMDATRRARILRWEAVNTERKLDEMGKDYQSIMGQRAIASGGVTGQGLGGGYLKLGFLPLKSSDFIFGHITEELGLIGSGVILSFYGLLLYQGGLIMTRATDRFGQLIAFGITFIFGMQAFIHAGVVTKLLPNKGINLPFISAGGTGLIIMAAAGGLLAAVARGTAAAVRSPAAEPVEPAAEPNRAPAAEPVRRPEQIYPRDNVPEVLPQPDLPAAMNPITGRRGFDRARLAKLLGS